MNLSDTLKSAINTDADKLFEITQRQAATISKQEGEKADYETANMQLMERIAQLEAALQEVSAVMYDLPLLQLGNGDTTQGQNLIRKIRALLANTPRCSVCGRVDANHLHDKKHKAGTK